MPTRFATTRPGLTLVVAGVLFLVLAAVAAGAMNALSLNRFEATNAPSAAAEALLNDTFQTGTPNITILVTAKTGDVDSSAVAADGLRLTEFVDTFPGIDDTWSYWTEEVPTLAAGDGSSALIQAWAPGDATEIRQQVLPALDEALSRSATSNIDIALGGSDEVFRSVAEQSRTDFLRAELIIAPLVIALLWAVLRRLRLAAVVFATGLFSVVGTLAIMRVVAAFTEVSTFAANIALVMGIALGVDYGLFLIYRFREEARRTADLTLAVQRAAQAAGRTIMFSGATVAASLAVLLVFPFPFLASFAYAGIAVVATAVLAATVVLPAALVLLGHRALRRKEPDTDGSTVWRRITVATTGRPAVFAIAGVVILILLGAPVLGVRFGAPDDRILPQSVPVRALYDTIRDDYASEDADAILLVAPTIAPDGLARYASDLAALPQVLRVDSALGTVEPDRALTAPPNGAVRFTPDTAGSYLSVVPTRESLDDRAGFVSAVRSVEPPGQVLVGGSPAMLDDYTDGVTARLPLVAVLIALITFAILFVMTGSIIAPIKATILNLLSLTVMFGVLVWGFQNGNLAGLLGFTPTGAIEPSIPILMFCIAYGLSMDYEVFLLSRIKEEFDRTGDNRQSIIDGISRSAPVVTAAALILAASFATYATSGVTFLQQLGIGMALAVLIDATVIRAILVPSIMALTGRWNWWAPRPLARLHQLIGITDAPRVDTPGTEVDPGRPKTPV
ncbi:MULTISPECIES: MMPL family transporter [Nocardiaceae]|uniref:MMPL family transporter n=1 Tax=Nocardiaceae TaxID=85025 RepID=UPI0006898AEF|nr:MULTISPECIES: MMPL family transporter [Rhodococcus]AMY56225.1 Putative membrane protein mmpL11 [Rhodococcus fascians D188]OZC43736.1 RND transporter [Rhodococcus sp. RS1C4]OZC51359.1 RND transporter [Rhodococcus sp. 06-621-2]OZC60778.1 RND transporter [Rhodococcus sp. 06-469-3-2]OZC65320.1 RND transporter [Rhodococcus sp. 06-462-5]